MFDTTVIIVISVLISFILFAGLKIGCISGVFGLTGSFLLGHNYKYSKDVENIITKLIEQSNQSNTTSDKYCLIFEGHDEQIWVANKYHGYGTLWSGTKGSLKSAGRCSLKTAKRVLALEKQIKGE